MDYCGLVKARQEGGQLLCVARLKNHLAASVIWASIEKELSRTTPRLLTICTSVRGTP